MIHQLHWSRNGNKLLLFGELCFDLLIPLWKVRQEIVKNIMYIDLSNISRTDTAGIAILIHFVELGKKNGVNITILNISNSILPILQLYNLPPDMLPH